MGSDVRTREPRERLLTDARLRAGGRWSDICLVNVSRRGLGAQMACPPAAGTYVEIHRGQYCIVARVVWTKGHRLGLRTQDPIDLPALRTARPARAANIERRSKHRLERDRREERSREVARMIEFAFNAVAAVSIGWAVVATMQQSLSKPLSEIRRVL